MLLTSVVLILQETLEASLLVAILAVATLQTGRRLSWLPWGFLAGCALGFVYAANLQSISEWFDYVGQELANAALQLTIAAGAVPLAWLIARSHVHGAGREDIGGEPVETPRAGPSGLLFPLLCALTVLLAITREGSEIMVYLGGFLGQDEKVQAGDRQRPGLRHRRQRGLLTFYGLLALGGRRGRWVPVALLALFSGNMLAQSALQLNQADWLQAGPTLWDSSAWLPEQSIPGHLLYALLGYESSPSLTQVVAYLAGVATVLAVALAASLVEPRNAQRSS
jgi:high-affinity iron transporter